MMGPSYGATRADLNRTVPQNWQEQPAPAQKQEEQPAPVPQQAAPQPAVQPQEVRPTNITVLPQQSPRISFRWLLWLAGGMALAFFILWLLSEGEKEEVREQQQKTGGSNAQRQEREEYDYNDREDNNRRTSGGGQEGRRESRREPAPQNPLNILPIVIPQAQAHTPPPANGGNQS